MNVATCARWYVFHYDQTEHPLGPVVVCSSRKVNVPGLPPLTADRQFTHEQLWQAIDGYAVRLAGFERFQHPGLLENRPLLISGFGDDSLVLVQVEGFYDGEVSFDYLAVPRQCLVAASEDECTLFELNRRTAPSVQKRLLAKFQEKFYEGEDVYHNFEFVYERPVKGIVVFDNPSQDFMLLHGHADLQSTVLAGSVLGPQLNWPVGAWENLHLLGGCRDNNGRLYVEMINEFLPDMWQVDRQFADLAEEAFVPVRTPKGSRGILTWSRSI